MSLISSLYTGVSGLQTFGASMQVIGDNIANVQTIGFKGGRAEFAALLGQAIAGGSDIGRGVTLDQVTTSFAQGSFSNTDRLTDLGIDGKGFFVVNDGQQDFYTRNGQFSIDNSGFLVNSRGYKVQGFPIDNLGNIQPKGDLQIGASGALPQATTDGVSGAGVIMQMNLDSRSTVFDPATQPFDPTSGATAQSSSTFSSTITVYDSLGNPHATTVYFRKVSEPSPTDNPPQSSWEWHAGVNASEVNNAVGQNELFIGASGTLVFNADGSLQSNTLDAASQNFSFTGAVPDQVVGFDFGSTIAGGGTGLDGTTQFAGANTVRTQSQDGYAEGALSTISISPDGEIVGFFTNGQAIAIGNMLLANFGNDQGLRSAGSGLYRESLDSGQPVLGQATTGGLGSISTFTLELSNVDLANEFVNMVTTQRAYQANSRIISTVDRLLEDVVNIIR